MKHTDSTKFINRSLMIRELMEVGVTVADSAAESDIVYMYNLHFLVNNYEHKNESLRYKPSGLRMATGPYRGKFPSTYPKK